MYTFQCIFYIVQESVEKNSSAKNTIKEKQQRERQERGWEEGGDAKTLFPEE
jgi:hypothetical protein